MNRRKFLRFLASGSAIAAASSLLPKILLSERRYFLPPKGGWPYSATDLYYGLDDYEDDIVRMGGHDWHNDQNIVRVIQPGWAINNDPLPMRVDMVEHWINIAGVA